MLRFRRDAAVASQRLVARILPDPAALATPAAARKGKRWVGRASVARSASTALIVTLFAALAFVGVGGQPAANAGMFDFMCMDGDTGKGPQLQGAGLDALIPAWSPVTGMKLPGYAGLAKAERPAAFTGDVLPNEWYGMSGLMFSSVFGQKGDDTIHPPCWDAQKVSGDFIANTMFTFAKIIDSVSIAVYRWAADPDLLSDSLGPLDKIVNGGDGVGGLKQSLYLEYIIPIIMLGALYMAWIGLVKKQSTEAAQAAIWMICAYAFAMIFMAHPSLIADKASQGISTITSGVMTSVTRTPSSAVSKDDICYLPLDTAKSPGVRMASCSIYKALAFTPWGTGQFGASPGVYLQANEKTLAACRKLDGGNGCTVGNRKVTDLREVQLATQAVSQGELARAPMTGDFVTASTQNQIAAQHNKAWDVMAEQILKDTPYSDAWRGNDPGSRLSTAASALAAALAAGTLIILISFACVVLAVGMLLLLMMSPLFLLVGAHPGFGRGVALKWLELLIGTAMKRIVLGILLSVVIGMFQVILSTSMSWFSQIGLILAVGIGAVMYRKPMLEAFKVINLGGSRSGMENGNVFQRPAKKASGTGSGAAVGAVTSGLAGGGIVAGAMKGGMMGARSGSPTRSAMMGAGAGRRVGAQATAKKEAAKKAKEDEQEAEGASPRANKPGIRSALKTLVTPLDPFPLPDAPAPTPVPAGNASPMPVSGGEKPKPGRTAQEVEADDELWGLIEALGDEPEVSGGGGSPRPASESEPNTSTGRSVNSGSSPANAELKQRALDNGHRPTGAGPLSGGDL